MAADETITEYAEGDENGALLLRRYSKGLVLLNTATDRNLGS
ncbi:MAG: hypothetical protein QXG69_01475 [Candidatus Caldarchaeum sp.]